jgi:peptidoglycan/xylan/chitin deacetylase (PgdA/CDA1 family)
MAGLTIEDVNTMQDEMNKIGDEAHPDAASADAEAAKLEEAKAAEEAAAKAKEEADKKEAIAAKKDDGKPEDEIDTVRELKEQMRVSQEALKKITGDYLKLQKTMIDKGIISEEEVKESEAEEAQRQAAFAERQNKLVEMVTIMELNPNYADVRQVCSQGNLDDIVDAFARYYVKENGGNMQDVATKMEMEIWSEPNPYKKIYELVKKYHPKYAVADTDKDAVKKAEEDAKKIADEADKVKGKKPVDANPSAASIGTGGSGMGSSGWTSAKIDALPEDELSKVPKDLYDKYLKGTLD